MVNLYIRYDKRLSNTTDVSFLLKYAEDRKGREARRDRRRDARARAAAMRPIASELGKRARVPF